LGWEIFKDCLDWGLLCTIGSDFLRLLVIVRVEFVGVFLFLSCFADSTGLPCSSFSRLPFRPRWSDCMGIL